MTEEEKKAHQQLIEVYDTLADSFLDLCRQYDKVGRKLKVVGEILHVLGVGKIKKEEKVYEMRMETDG